MRPSSLAVACLLVPALAIAEPGPPSDDDELSKLADDEVIEVHAQAPRPASESAYQVSSDEIRALPGGGDDALAAVRSMPGVSMAPAVAGGRLVIRGGAPQDSLLEIDGVPVPFVYHAFDNSTIVPVSMIGAITYNPGGFGVSEGRATSGSVEILTRDDPPQRAGVEASLSMLDASMHAALPISVAHGLYLSGGARRSTVDLLIPLAAPADLMIGFTTPPRYYDGQLRLDWIPDAADRVTLLAITSYDRLGIVNHMEGSDLPPDFAQDSRFGRLIASWKRETEHVRNRLVAALGDGTFHARFDSFQHDDDRDVLALVRDDVSLAAGRFLRVRAGGFAQTERHDLSVQSILVSGDGLPPGHFYDLPIYSLATAYDASYAAAYAAADVLPSSTTTLTGGVRVERFGHVNATVLEPRVELAQRLGDVTLHAAVGSYARDPTQAEGIPMNLLPEQAVQISTSADVVLGEGLSASAAAYRTTHEHLAVEDPALLAMPGTLPFASTGRGLSYGADLMLRLRRDHLFGWLAYSYGHTTRQDLPGTAWHATPFDQTHALTAVASFERGPWRFGGRFQLATGLPYTDVVGATYDASAGRYLPVLGPLDGARFPDVAQLSLRAERVWKRRALTIAAFIDVTNVFRDARVERFTYSPDFSTRTPLTDYVPLPSVGIRGEL